MLISSARRRRRQETTGASYSPLIVNPYAWLDGDDLTGLYANLAEIVAWPNKGSNGGSAVLDTVGPKLLQAAGINGLPSANFTAANAEYLNLTGLGLNVLTEVEVFIVLKRTDDPPTDGSHTGLWMLDSGAAGTSTHAPYTDGTIYDVCFSSTRQIVGNPAASLASAALYNVVSKAGEWTARQNGVQLFTTASNTVAAPSVPLLGKGAGSYYMDGLIAQFIACPVLSDAARLLLQSWAITKYNIT